ncbi:MAG: hypothetical protein ACYCZM_05010, partial [Acidimicrobiales bacterium]
MMSPSPPTGSPRRQTLIVAVVIIVVIAGFLGAVLASNSGTRSATAPPPTAGLAPGVTAAGVAGSPNPILAGSVHSVATDFARLVANGNPPPDILGSTVVPDAASPSQYVNNDQSSGPYDRSVTFSLHGLFNDVLGFFTYQLKDRGWRIGSTTKPAHHEGLEILAMRPGSDGFFWQVGVTVS